MVIFQSFLYVYQRVIIDLPWDFPMVLKPEKPGQPEVQYPVSTRDADNMCSNYKRHLSAEVRWVRRIVGESCADVPELYVGVYYI